MVNLNYEKLKKLSVEEIYNYLKEDYVNLFKSYNYIFKTYPEFFIVIKNILTDIIIKLPQSSNNYQNYLLKQSKVRLNKYVKNMLDGEDKINIISSYIDLNLDESPNELKELKKLIRWLQIIDYIPDPSVIIELVTTNQKLNNILANIIDQNISKIKQYGLDNVFPDELVFEFLDVYASINNKFDDEIDNYNLDSEKLKGTYLGAEAIIQELKSQKLYVLSKEEERELFLKLQQGDSDAYNQILNHNLRLVVNISRRYLNHGLEYEDLIQEGNIGLLKAIERYDVTKGYKFSTYATWWIRQAITRAIGNLGRGIRLPIHKIEKLKKFRKQVEDLANKLGYEPSFSEIADNLQITYSKVKENFELMQLPTSLNAKVGDDEENELGDFIPDLTNSNLEDDTINQNLVREIDQLLKEAGLTEIERSILKYRYGLNYTDEKILEDIGSLYGITRERVRQKESKAIIKLRKYLPTQKFAYYLDNPKIAKEKLEKLRNWHCNNPKSYIVYNLDLDKIEEDFHKAPTKKAKSRHLKTIYEVLPNYTKEEINAAIEKLTPEDKALFYLRNGEDLENPKPTKNVDDLNYRYVLVVEKIKRKLNSPRKIKTIYECLSKYSKKDINKGISMLNKDDKMLIYYRYGSNLEHPVATPLWDSAKYRNYFYNTLFRKIERNIESTKRKTKKRNIKSHKKLISIYQQLSDFSKEDVDEELAKLDIKDKKIIYLRNGEDLEHPNPSPKFTGNMKTRYYNIVHTMKVNLASLPKYKEASVLNSNNEKELRLFYIRAIELLKSPLFIKLLLDLSVKEAIILAMIILSYLENREINLEDIAYLLEVNSLEIKEDYQKMLLLFKENMNEYLNINISNNDTRKK